ncbi:MAG: hypothetical protein H6581_11120 [Bacteroidia bacterium]|nr:hypothetical protein [Bacteroidia bacterium]
MKLILRFLSVITLILFYSCTTQTRQIMPVTCTYADGNGNSYTLKNTPGFTFEYRSVTPKNSSSGVYSGGEPVYKTISESEFEKVRGLIAILLDDESIRIEKRLLGSGFLKIEANGQVKMQFIDGKAPGLSELDSVVKQMRQE